ncbi:MAG: V-type ATP synthase subunit I [Spirochaetaceae bacterium]
MFPSRMRYLVAAVLDAAADPLSRELLHLGVLHFVNVRDLDRSHRLRAEAVGEERRRVAEVRRRVESTLATGGMSVPATVGPRPGTEVVDVEACERLLDEVGKEIENLRARQRELQQQIMRLEELNRQVTVYAEAGRAAQSTGGHSYLDVRAGSVPRDRIEELRRELSSFPATDVELGGTEDRAEVLLLTLKRNAASIAEIRRRHRWEDIDLPAPDELPGDVQAAGVREKLEAAREQQERIGEQVKEVVARRREELERAWGDLRHGELVLDVRSHFEHTERTVVFSGWVPEEYVAQVDEAVRRLSAGRCYLTWHGGREVEEQEQVRVPVRLKNPKVLKPFQMLVENYGTPAYGTVDPTILVAVAYLTMFGLMFADAGHGAVLLLAGILGLRSPRVQGRTRELFGLLVWCAASAITFGVLFGAYFGMQWLPPVWFDFHGVVSGHAGEGAITSIFDILTLTIYLGIAVIGTGFVLNWINLARTRHWLDVIFDRAGLVTAWLYAGGIYTAYHFVQSGYRRLPGGTEVTVALVVPALLLLLKEPAKALFARGGGGGAENGAGAGERPPRGIAGATVAAIMNWLLELLEVGSGYLANTLSFMRVAGLGIAHVTLMTAFFEIASPAAGDGGYSVFSILILIFGNALVIVLEGLSAGIQSLRLNYYEFFSRYFSGSGEVYRPISLAGRA